MRIGIFSDRYLPQTDGITFSTEIFRKELEALGHEVYVFAPSPSWRYKERSKRIIRFKALKGLLLEDWLTGVFFPPQAIKQIDKLNLDIIHCQTPSSIGLLGTYYAINRRLPLVTTYHTDMYEYVKHYPQILPGIIMLSLFAPIITGGDMQGFRQALMSIRPETSIDKWNQKIILRGFTLFHNNCNLVISPSKKIKKKLVSWKTQSKIVILPTGVDEITTTTREINAFRNKHGLSPQDKIVSLVCRITTEKNIELLISAFDIIGQSIPEAKLIIAGPGDDLPLYQKQAAESHFPDRIIFTGFIDRQKLGALYKITDVFAFPSLTDTQGMSVNEAACSGAPVVLVDRDITEVVRNQYNGYFSRNSAKDFASKIVTILKDDALRERMSRNSRQLAAQVSAKEQGAKLAGLYEETIEQHQAHPPATSRNWLSNFNKPSA